MKKGTQFENLTAEVFSILCRSAAGSCVERNVFMMGSDGKRQIDVKMTTNIGPISVTTIIECRDYKGILDVTHVDGLHSVMQDVLANQAILVTRKGFSSKAKRKAARLGILLFTLDEARKLNWDCQIQLPISICEISIDGFRPSFRFHVQERSVTIPIENTFLVNDRDILSEIRDIATKTSGEEELSAAINELCKGDGKFVRDQRGDKMLIEDLKIDYSLTRRYFFGFIHDLSWVYVLDDVATLKRTIVFKSENFPLDYYAFPEFSTPIDFPGVPLISFQVILKGDFVREGSSLNVTELSRGDKMSFEIRDGRWRKR
jgi:hypothetical protein